MSSEKSNLDLHLLQVFNSTFHNKYLFEDFLHLDVLTECEEFFINGRTIYKPSSKLKAFHRFINNCILEYADINENVVFSYRKGKSTYDAVKKHANSKFFFQTDMNDFFGSLTVDYIRKIFESNLGNVPISDISKFKESILQLIVVNDSLPKGFPTSPVISNTCLYQFDNSLEDYCTGNEIIYTRYSDDLILSSKNSLALDNIEKIICDLLNKFFNAKIKLNKSKTKYTHKGNKVKFLGIVILPSGKLSIDMKIKNKIETSLHFYLNDKEKFTNFVGGNYEDGLSMISGNLNYVNMIDKSYLNKLRKKYGNAIVDMFFHKTVK